MPQIVQAHPPQARRLDQLTEFPAVVAGRDGRSHVRGEDQPPVLPELTGRFPVQFLLLSPLRKKLHNHNHIRERYRAARPRRLWRHQLQTVARAPEAVPEARGDVGKSRASPLPPSTDPDRGGSRPYHRVPRRLLRVSLLINEAVLAGGFLLRQTGS